FQPAPLATSQSFMSKIDPTLLGTSSLVYSTYFGGGNPTTGTTIGGGIAVDQNNNVYITGGTNFLHVGNADDFPILNGYQSCLNVPPPSSTTTPPPSCTPTPGSTDAFLAKFNLAAASGAQLVYSTSFGGAVSAGTAVDSLQGARVTGWTNSGDFPLGSGTPIQSGLAGGIDAFISRIDTSVQSATAPGHFGTYLGGSANDFGTSIATDAQSNTYVVGETASGNFKTQSPLQSLKGG